MKSEKAVGTWRITSMEVWDADYVDMQVPAYLTIRDDLMGTFQFGLVQGDIDARVSEVDGVAHVEFSWSGTDENEPLSGRGWMDVAGSRAEGRIFIHLSDDSAFAATRQEAQIKAPLTIVQQDEDQLAPGKGKPGADVIKGLWRVK
jgi:hypothetical protein